MQQQTIQNSVLDKLATRNMDLHGRRIVNAGPSIDRNDYVTRAEVIALTKLIDDLTKQFNDLKAVVKGLL